jgi:hypothetical protein
MDILITFVIILVICLAVAPFFLLSGEFGAKSKGKDDGTGLITPVPGTGDGAIFPKKPADSGGDDNGGDRDEGSDATDDPP